jgi:hypothetical protein
MKVMVCTMATPPFSLLPPGGAHAGSRSTPSVVHLQNRIKAAPSQRHHISRSLPAKVIQGASHRANREVLAKLGQLCRLTAPKHGLKRWHLIYVQGRADAHVL